MHQRAHAREQARVDRVMDGMVAVVAEQPDYFAPQRLTNDKRISYHQDQSISSAKARRRSAAVTRALEEP